INGVDAQTAGKELERIREANDGRLRPEDVVVSAQKQDSPLHAIFTWDDSKAANEYRLSQARRLIRLVVIERKDMDVPAFFNVTTTVKQSPAGSGDTDESEDTAPPTPIRYYQSSVVLETSPDE